MDHSLEVNSSGLSAKRVLPDLLGTIAQMCKHLGGFKTFRERGLLIIQHADQQGFEIKVYDGGGPPAVVLGPWYGQLASERAVLNLVEKALMGAVRVRIESCRGRDHSWTAEVRTEAGIWAPIRENRIAELWPLHATLVRHVSMPFPVDRQVTAPTARSPQIEHAALPAEAPRASLPYYAFAQTRSRMSAGERPPALAM